MIYSAYLLPYTVDSKRKTPKGIEIERIDLWRMYVKERSSADANQFITKTRVFNSYKEAREQLKEFSNYYDFKEVIIFAVDDATKIEYIISDDTDELYAFLKYND
jgi:hypothetical protein